MSEPEHDQAANGARRDQRGEARAARLRERLWHGPPLVLDGAMGTELERRGIATPLPLWSAAALIDAPDAVLEVHRAYAGAGADLIVTNTFRTLDRAVAAAALEVDAGDLVRTAVELARAAAQAEHRREVFVLGSIGPLEDCYRPDLVPSEPALATEHRLRAEQLAMYGADALLVETMNTKREALAAIAAARSSGLPVLVSFVANPDGELFDGEPLDEVVPALIDAGPDVILLNCTPLATTARVVRRLAKLAAPLPFGVYANNGYGHPGAAVGTSEAVTESTLGPQAYARQAASWLEAGARLIGGCCGTSPVHIAALRELVDRREAAGVR